MSCVNTVGKKKKKEPAGDIGIRILCCCLFAAAAAAVSSQKEERCILCSFSPFRSFLAP